MTLRFKLILAFAAIYLIWGSTYLAIRLAIETLPPFMMAGVRFVIAGVMLYGWARWRGAPRPVRANWLAAAIVGGFMLLGGNGGVTWAEQRVPSGLTAVLIATVPLWIALLEWLRGGARPTARVAAGLATGLAGIVLLVGPGELGGGKGVDLVGASVLLIASLSWAIGSLYSRRAKLASSPLLATAMEMLCGGLLLLLAGLASGQVSDLNPSRISIQSILALCYLIAFGSLVAFTAYVWLLRVTLPARAATYAYVNPVVAVFLGWALAGEPLTARTLLAAAIIIGSVVIIAASQLRPGGEKSTEAAEVRLPAHEASGSKH
jgi:drug/metabolite transporter (DMT)-like permease